MDVCVCVIEKDGVFVLLGVIVADMVADVVLVSVLVTVPDKDAVLLGVCEFDAV